MDTEITARLNDSLAAALKTQTCRVSSVNAANDQVRQNAQAALLLKEECDLLIVEPVITLEAEAIAQMGQEADVPVIFLNYAPPEEVLQKYTGVYYIGSDLNSPGQLLQEKLKECDPGQNLILSGPEQHMDATLWTKQCREAMPENCLGVEYTDGSKESGRRLAARYLARKNDSLETVVCMNDNLTLGALEAVQQAERPVQFWHSESSFSQS
jgi:ABC-type sugar transport system substrate-binding protein